MLFFSFSPLIKHLKSIAYEFIYGSQTVYHIINNENYQWIFHNLFHKNFIIFNELPKFTQLFLKSFNGDFYNKYFWNCLLLIIDKEEKIYYFKYKIINILIFTGVLLIINLLLHWFFNINRIIIILILLINGTIIGYYVYEYGQKSQDLYTELELLLFIITVIHHNSVEKYHYHKLFHRFMEDLYKGKSLLDLLYIIYQQNNWVTNQEFVQWSYGQIEYKLNIYYNEMEVFFDKLYQVIMILIMGSVLILIISGGFFMINYLMNYNYFH